MEQEQKEKKEIENYWELPPFVCDDLHFNSKEIDGYNVPFNFVICCREAGKSTDFWRKQYMYFRKTGNPAMVIKRQQNEITDLFVADIEFLIQKFTKTELKLKFSKSQCQSPRMDVYLCGRIFFRVFGLSAKMHDLKGGVLPNIRYCLLDEFIVNLRLGEKYLTGEVTKFEELHTTYNRESPKGIKCYFHGNPYSHFNPYFTWLGVDSKKLKKGTIVKGKKYVVQCYDISEELKEHILAHNPLYEFDDAYKKYGFDGEPVNDENIFLMEKQPNGFSLKWVFKLQDKYLGVFSGFEFIDDSPYPLRYWTKVVDREKLSLSRNIIVFDFGQATNGSNMYRKRGVATLESLKHAMEFREIAFNNIEASYLMEEIYYNL